MPIWDAKPPNALFAAAIAFGSIPPPPGPILIFATAPLFARPLGPPLSYIICMCCIISWTVLSLHSKCLYHGAPFGAFGSGHGFESLASR